MASEDTEKKEVPSPTIVYPISEFNNELIVEILSKLSVGEQLRASRLVSHRWYGLTLYSVTKAARFALASPVTLLANILPQHGGGDLFGPHFISNAQTPLELCLQMVNLTELSLFQVEYTRLRGGLADLLQRNVGSLVRLRLHLKHCLHSEWRLHLFPMIDQMTPRLCRLSVNTQVTSDHLPRLLRTRRLRLECYEFTEVPQGQGQIMHQPEFSRLQDRLADDDGPRIVVVPFADLAAAAAGDAAPNVNVQVQGQEQPQQQEEEAPNAANAEPNADDEVDQDQGN